MHPSFRPVPGCAAISSLGDLHWSVPWFIICCFPTFEFQHADCDFRRTTRSKGAGCGPSGFISILDSVDMTSDQSTDLGSHSMGLSPSFAGRSMGLGLPSCFAFGFPTASHPEIERINLISRALGTCIGGNHDRFETSLPLGVPGNRQPPSRARRA